MEQLSNETILEHVKEKYDRGLNSVQEIRDEFRQENILFHDQRENKETIGDTTFFNIHSAFMARTYIEKPKARFVSTKYSANAKYMVDNLNAALQADMNEEDIEILRYQKNYDKYKYGAGIVARIGWDGIRKMPTWECADPRTVIPDPDGDYLMGKYNFIGFEVNKRIEDLPEDWDTDGLVIQKIAGDSAEDQTRLNAGLQDIGNDQFDPVYALVYMYITIERQKYFVVTGNSNSHLVYVQKLEAITREQKEDESLVKFPVIIDNWKPERNNIFGHRLAVICKNTQMAITLLQNLRLKKIQAELYPMYLYNSRLIKKREYLDFGFNKMIATNPMEGESIANAVVPLQKDLTQNGSAELESMLQNNLTRSTGGMNSALTQGQTPERRETLGTNQIQEQNTDINLQLDDKISGWFEKRFVELWLEGHLQNFEDGDKKLVKIEAGMGFISIELTKAQFLSYYDVYIEITTNAEAEEKKTIFKNALTQSFQILQTIERPTISQNIGARQILEASGLSTENAEIQVPKTPQEMIAEQENLLLNESKQVNITSEDDHLTHMIAHKGALPTVARELHIMAHLEAYNRSGQKLQSMVGADQNAKNIQQGMVASQLSSEQARQQQ